MKKKEIILFYKLYKIILMIQHTIYQKYEGRK